MSDLDGQLAWAINTWAVTHTPLDRGQVESLTKHLTAEGFRKPVTDPFEGLKALRPTVERMFKSADEFLGGKPRATAADSTD